MSAQQFTPIEQEAIHAAALASVAVANAIAAYQRAGFGSCVTEPLHDALSDIEFSVKQVKS